MSHIIKFGTDGWRGIIAEDFTFENVRFCAQGVAEYLIEAGLADRGLIIGYDTRFASEDFAAAAASVVAANGVKVYLCHRAIPTPIISYTIARHSAGGAIIITASHNPGSWNGLKFRGPDAFAAPPQVLAQLEGRIAQIQARGDVRHMPLDQAVRNGLVEMFDPSPHYLQHIGGLVDLDVLRHSGLRVVADSMYGAGTGYFRAILGGGNTEVTELHGDRNPLFPGLRPEPIAANLSNLCSKVVEVSGSVGLATDGDADRLGIVDEKGNYLNTLQVFALLALYLLEVRGQRGPIVKTVTSSDMLYRLGDLYGVPVYETPVGFKYVAPKMLAEDALIGGEESGGYAFRGHVLERDGILSGLFFLDLMVRQKKTPSQLLDYLYSIVGPHYYDRTDIAFPTTERQEIIARISKCVPTQLDDTRIQALDTSDGFRYQLVDRGWLLIRFSGTEPLLRIYAESNSPERVKRLLAEGRGLVGL